MMTIKMTTKMTKTQVIDPPPFPVLEAASAAAATCVLAATETAAGVFVAVTTSPATVVTGASDGVNFFGVRLGETAAAFTVKVELTPVIGVWPLAKNAADWPPTLTTPLPAFFAVNKMVPNIVGAEIPPV